MSAASIPNASFVLICECVLVHVGSCVFQKMVTADEFKALHDNGGQRDRAVIVN